jgi:hypothetical protein
MKKGVTYQLRLKGVCYDTGTIYYFNWRPQFDRQVVHRELGIIKNDLHCNSIRISGFSVERLEFVAEDALEQGLEVWLSPQLWDKDWKKTIQYMADVAKMAERLRKKWSDRIVFSVGSESTLFTKGILEGKNVSERMSNRKNWERIKAGEHNKALNEFLKKTSNSVRQVFNGKITYASLIWEVVDWNLFDFIGVDHYMVKKIEMQYTDMLKPLLKLNKPVVITEFGFRTYQGASSSSEGMAGDIVDHRTELLHHLPILSRLVKPKIRGKHIRDENSQARELVNQLTILDNVGVDGAFVSTFVFPLYPYDSNPRYDLDMASYSLVKSFSRSNHGVVYPDMSWEPKESFNAVADYYKNH